MTSTQDDQFGVGTFTIVLNSGETLQVPGDQFRRWSNGKIQAGDRFIDPGSWQSVEWHANDNQAS